MEPGYWGVYFSFGNFLHRQGRHAESVEYYRQVTQLAPDYAGGYINLGAALHWLGDWDGAETAWQRALELEPDSLTYENMGTLFYYEHEFENAVEMQRKAIEIAPSDHRPWGKLAAALRYVPEADDEAAPYYAEAIRLVEKQLVINPDQPEDLAYLAVYRTNSGDHDVARQAINRSLQLAPESPTAHYFNAILEINTGNDEKALRELAKSVELGYSLKLLEADPEFARLRGNPEFRTMLRD
jgi:serine/threonine-protein kinase